MKGCNMCCNPIDCVCSPICSIIHTILLLGILGISIYTAVEVSDQDGTLSQVYQNVQGNIHIDAIDDVIDLSRYPKSSSEMFANTSAGSPCNGLQKGDRCATGLVLLNKNTHCNNCCFQLVTPDSCGDFSCTCYSNDQDVSHANRRRLILISNNKLLRPIDDTYENAVNHVERSLRLSSQKS